MDSLQCEQQAREDPHISVFLREVAEDAAQDIAVEEPQRFVTVTGVDLLLGLVAYALSRLAKDYLDNRRALHEVDIAKQQAQVIADLIEAGFPPKDARATAVALFKGIAKRIGDDPVLKKALAMTSKTQ